jgi:hypothetical protein
MPKMNRKRLLKPMKFKRKNVWKKSMRPKGKRKPLQA